MVGYPADVEEVYLGEDGIFKHAKKGALAVDMTTSSPPWLSGSMRKGKKRVYGSWMRRYPAGNSGARNATLSIMAGGDAQDFEEIKPIFECMGKNIVYLGPAGTGSTPRLPTRSPSPAQPLP